MRWLAGEGEGGEREEPGDGGPQEHGAELRSGRGPRRTARRVQGAGAEERAERGAGVIHRAVEAERPGAHPLGGDRRDERVARARPDALAHPVDRADREHVPGRRGERDSGRATVERAYPARTIGFSRARRSAARPDR